MNRSYPSKVDWWIAALVVVPAVVLALVGPLSGEYWLLPFAPLAPLLSFPCRYEVGGGWVRARCGIARLSLPTDEIVSLRPKRSTLSSPALSMDRLEIRTAKRAMMVSPADKEGFLAAIAEQNPRLQRVGNGLERR